MKTTTTAAIPIKKAKTGAVVIGMGFIPLDLVYTDDVPGRYKAYAGGTCGNVLAILAFLGWNAYPIARNDHSVVGQMIAEDLAASGVNTKFLAVTPTAAPPIVVQRIFSQPRGHKTHSFSWYCPGCGAHLPSFKPVLAKSVVEIESQLPRAKMFFFDRVSRAALDLAKNVSASGGVVVFEPSMIGEPKLFSEALSLCHIFKYSQDRITNVNELRGSKQPVVEIETLGSAGLRYRFGNKWAEMGAYTLPTPIDTSGAGDWFTAGVVHGICQNGQDGLSKITNANLKAAIQLGQAMATWNCQFPAARGGMYGTTWSEWRTSIQYVLKHGSPLLESDRPTTRHCPEVLTDICCEKKSRTNKSEMKARASTQLDRCMTIRQGGSLGKAIPR